MLAALAATFTDVMPYAAPLAAYGSPSDRPARFCNQTKLQLKGSYSPSFGVPRRSVVTALRTTPPNLLTSAIFSWPSSA